MATSVLPFVALLGVQKSRRRRLLPLALPAATGMPAAQAGALAIVSADSVARREGNVATAEATTDMTAVLTTAVENGAVLTVEDLKGIPLAEKVVAANPDILTSRSLEGISRADLERAMTVIQRAMTKRDGVRPDGDSKELTLSGDLPPKTAYPPPMDPDQYGHHETEDSDDRREE
jgi:hypothetical protein